MSISAESVKFDDNQMWVSLSDGRVIGVPLAWFPKLMNASKKDKDAVEVSAFGLHWVKLDEDISVEGLLAGRGDQSSVGGEAA